VKTLIIIKSMYGEICVREAFTSEMFKSVGDFVPPRYDDDFKHEKWEILEFRNIDVRRHC